MGFYQGKKVLIMGLGLNRHGSGTEAALYLARLGARLTITDLRDATVLAPTINLFTEFDVKWVLGHHCQEDFDEADLIIKNPGVRKDSPFLKNISPSKIETDLSLFLVKNSSPIIAVTGSKGKSSIVTSIQRIYEQTGRKSFLGGNITVSPLSFIDQLTGHEDLILELSSWQLGDLKAKKLLHPKIALITNLMHDHQNYYNNKMDDYADDKATILEGQSATDWAIFNIDDAYTPFFVTKTKARCAFFSKHLINQSHKTALYLHSNQLIWRFNGVEQCYAKPSSYLIDENLLALLIVLLLDGFEMEQLLGLVGGLKAPPHRMEFVRDVAGRLFYNDSAATIPEATVAALNRFPHAHVIIGGSDKELDFQCLVAPLKLASSVTLLGGSAAEKLKSILDENAIGYQGPFSNFDEAVNHAYSSTKEGDVVLLSPGATSFGMFLNEFDRGNQFKLIINALT